MVGGLSPRIQRLVDSAPDSVAPTAAAFKNRVQPSLTKPCPGKCGGYDATVAPQYSPYCFEEADAGRRSNVRRSPLEGGGPLAVSARFPRVAKDSRHLKRTLFGAFLSRLPNALRLLRNRDEYCEKQHERERFSSTADQWLHKALERQCLSRGRHQDFPDRLER